jgi:hypothetical protein
MAHVGRSQSSPITGARVTALVIAWLAIVSLAAASLELYYEALAAWYTVPPLILVYAYCGSHRHRATALLAVAATLVAGLAIGFAIVIPKAQATAAAATTHLADAGESAVLGALAHVVAGCLLSPIASEDVAVGGAPGPLTAMSGAPTFEA